MIKKAEDLDSQDGIAETIYFIPRTECRAHYMFEYIGGPKKYLHIKIHDQGKVDSWWGWQLPRTAILLWKQSND